MKVVLVESELSRAGPWSRVRSLLAQDPRGTSVQTLSIDPLNRGEPRNGVDCPDELRLTLESALESTKSPEIVNRYCDFSSSQNFQLFRFIALKLLNRLDLTGTFRLIDREAILWGYVLETIDVLSRADPSILVFEVTPHEFGEFVVWSVAEWMGVKALFFQPCSLAPVMLPRRNLDDAVITDGGMVSSATHSELITTIARERIERLDQGLAPSYMETQRARDVVVRKARHRLLALRSSLMWLFQERFPESIDFSGHEHRHRIVMRAVKVFLVRSLQANLRKRVLGLGAAVDNKQTYSVFALHYEPERTSIPDGFPIVFQGDALAWARAFVPDEVLLVVKEHYSQQSSALRGFLGRSPYFHDVARTMPNTRFGLTTEALSNLVSGAECVFTLTGTVAIEAVFRGVPVVYFGNPWWAGLPGTIRAQPGAIFDELQTIDMPSRAEVVAYLLDLVRDNMIPGTPDGSAQVGGSVVLPPDFQESAALSIHRCIRSELAL